MVYCVADMCVEEFVQDFGKVVGRGDLVILDRKVVGRICLDQPYIDVGLGDIVALSKDSQVVCVVPFRCFDRIECTNSVCIVDCGKILCLQDEIFANSGYVSRNRIFLTHTSIGKIGLVIDNDLMYVGVWSKYIGSGVRYMLHCNHTQCDGKGIVMLQAMSLAIGCVAIGVWCDQTIVASGGKIVDIAVGKFRPLWINHSVEKSYLTTSPILVYQAGNQKDKNSQK